MEKIQGMINRFRVLDADMLRNGDYDRMGSMLLEFMRDLPGFLEYVYERTRNDGRTLADAIIQYEEVCQANHQLRRIDLGDAPACEAYAYNTATVEEGNIYLPIDYCDRLIKAGYGPLLVGMDRLESPQLPESFLCFQKSEMYEEYKKLCKPNETMTGRSDDVVAALGCALNCAKNLQYDQYYYYGFDLGSGPDRTVITYIDESGPGRYVNDLLRHIRTLVRVFSPVGSEQHSAVTNANSFVKQVEKELKDVEPAGGGKAGE